MLSIELRVNSCGCVQDEPCGIKCTTKRASHQRALLKGVMRASYRNNLDNWFNLNEKQ